MNELSRLVLWSAVSAVLLILAGGLVPRSLRGRLGVSAFRQHVEGPPPAPRLRGGADDGVWAGKIAADAPIDEARESCHGNADGVFGRHSRVLDALGPQRLMWASHCPFQVVGGHTDHDSIDLIHRRLGFLTAGDRDWLLRKMAGRFFLA